jgi:hypothetical protein
MVDKRQPNSAPFLLIVGDLPALRSLELGNGQLRQS